MQPQDDPDEVARIKKRFDTDFLPKYGSLWRQVLQKSKSSNSNSNSNNVINTPATADEDNRVKPVNFLDAIEAKGAVTLVVPSCRSKTAPNGSSTEGQFEACPCCVEPIVVDSDVELSSNDNDDGTDEGDWIDGDSSTSYVEGSTPCPSPIGVGQGFEDDGDSTETECSDEDDEQQASDEEENFNEDEDDDGSHNTSGSTVIHFDLSAVLQSSPPKDRPRRENDESAHPSIDKQTQGENENASGTSTAREQSCTSKVASSSKSDSQYYSLPDEALPVARAGPVARSTKRPSPKASSSIPQVIDLVDSDSEDHISVAEFVYQNDFSVRQKHHVEQTPERIAHSKDSEDESGEEEEWNGNLDDEEGVSRSSGSKVRDDDNAMEEIVRRTEYVTLSDSDDDVSFVSPPSICDVDSLGSSGNNENRDPKSNNLKEKQTPKSKGLNKASFRKNRESLALAALIEFDNKAFGNRLGSVVDVEWSTKLRTTAGLTRLKRSRMNMRPGFPLDRTASIELSTKVLDNVDRLRSTLLHEMVHAAAWIVDGVSRPPHGTCFKQWARKAMKSIPGVVVTTTHNYEIEFKYAWACTAPGCSFVVKRHSRSVDLSKHCCGRCKGRLVEINVPQQGSKNVASEEIDRTPRKKAPASGYNLFVKEHSKSVRERLLRAQRAKGGQRPKVAQSDVMKECAKLWRQQKEAT